LLNLDLVPATAHHVELAAERLDGVGEDEVLNR
jgi:hypothetical protein